MPHVETCIRVSNLERLSSFYEAVLKPAGIRIAPRSDDRTVVVFSYPYLGGLRRHPPCLVLVDATIPSIFGISLTLGDDGKVQLWSDADGDSDLVRMEAAYRALEHIRSGESTVSRNLNIRLEAGDRKSVDEFQKIATAEGARIIIPASHRPERGKYYYGALVQDPDGRTVELAFDEPRFFWLVRLAYWVAIIVLYVSLFARIAKHK